MSGLAEILLEEHFTISGSDARESDLTRHLEHMGVTVYYGQAASNIKEGVDLVVYTAAIREDNPEFLRARELNIPMMSRAELLGQIMDNYENSIAIAGTHGKTTTTSMISQILLAAKADPTITVGGILKALDGNYFCVRGMRVHKQLPALLSEIQHRIKCRSRTPRLF